MDQGSNQAFFSGLIGELQNRGARIGVYTVIIQYPTCVTFIIICSLTRSGSPLWEGGLAVPRFRFGTHTTTTIRASGQFIFYLTHVVAHLLH